jgi:hypothetical protein
MRIVFLTAVTAAALAIGVLDVHAMGGGGNLSPEASPYAILAPQTVAPYAVPPPPAEVAPYRAYREPGRRRRRPERFPEGAPY